MQRRVLPRHVGVLIYRSSRVYLQLVCLGSWFLCFLALRPLSARLECLCRRPELSASPKLRKAVCICCSNPLGVVCLEGLRVYLHVKMVSMRSSWDSSFSAFMRALRSCKGGGLLVGTGCASQPLLKFAVSLCLSVICRCSNPPTPRKCSPQLNEGWWSVLASASASRAFAVGFNSRQSVQVVFSASRPPWHSVSVSRPGSCHSRRQRSAASDPRGAP